MREINRRTLVLAHDVFMVMAAWLLANLIRGSYEGYSIGLMPSPGMIATILLAQGLVLWKAGLYRGVWRFASIPDLWNIIRAAVLGTLAITLALFLFNRMEGVPRTALVLYPLFLIFLLGGPRLCYRLWKDHGLKIKISEAKRVLVIGAGRAGEMLVRDMRRNREYQPIGFLDDDIRLKGANIHGLPVFGAVDRLGEVVAERSVDIVMLAIPSASGIQMRRVVAMCDAANVPFRTLPRLQDLVSGHSVLQELRDVSIDDLLGRESVALDWKRISEGLAGKVVLLSGGGGSIGSELCRQIARLGPSKLVIVERSEFNLYSIELELRQHFPNLVLYPCLIDVCDKVAIERIFEEYQPEVVFHAAAYKHVPMLQAQIREAVHNNVLGTRLLASAADRYGCGIFVLVSTDKAVNPANVMGATKRVAEILCQTLSRYSQTKFITVRFGNVLGSAGSVVPLFRSQIEAGGPVTVTDPEISRYFMTIPEASLLIMQSAVLGDGGEIFVLDMGEPIKINYLAEQMIRLSGKVPGQDIEIVYTGLRPGEKLYEELFHDQENLAETAHEKIFLAHSRSVDREFVDTVLMDMEQSCATYDVERLTTLLYSLVPEMTAVTIMHSSHGNVIPFEKATS